MTLFKFNTYQHDTLKQHLEDRCKDLENQLERNQRFLEDFKDPLQHKHSYDDDSKVFWDLIWEIVHGIGSREQKELLARLQKAQDALAALPAEKQRRSL